MTTNWHFNPMFAETSNGRLLVCTFGASDPTEDICDIVPNNFTGIVRTEAECPLDGWLAFRFDITQGTVHEQSLGFTVYANEQNRWAFESDEPGSFFSRAAISFTEGYVQIAAVYVDGLAVWVPTMDTSDVTS